MRPKLQVEPAEEGSKPHAQRYPAVLRQRITHPLQKTKSQRVGHPAKAFFGIKAWPPAPARGARAAVRVGHPPVFLLHNSLAADSGLPLIANPEGLHPYLGKGGRTHDGT